jgi:hypothetical protein
MGTAVTSLSTACLSKHLSSSPHFLHLTRRNTKIKYFKFDDSMTVLFQSVGWGGGTGKGTWPRPEVQPVKIGYCERAGYIAVLVQLSPSRISDLKREDYDYTLPRLRSRFQGPLFQESVFGDEGQQIASRPRPTYPHECSRPLGCVGQAMV